MVENPKEEPVPVVLPAVESTDFVAEPDEFLTERGIPPAFTFVDIGAVPREDMTPVFTPPNLSPRRRDAGWFDAQPPPPPPPP